MQRGQPVVIVEADPHMRALLAQVARAAGLDVESFGTAEELVKAYGFDPTAPCWLLLDVRLPGLSGVDLEQIRFSCRTTIPAIVLTFFRDLPTAVNAIQSGSIRFAAVCGQNAVLSQSFSQARANDSLMDIAASPRDEIRKLIGGLSSRERSVFELLVDGKNNKEIANQLGVGLPTVTRHRSKLLRKLGVHNVVELVRLAVPFLGGPNADQVSST